MLTIFKKEINAFFGSLMAYIIIGFFVLVLGLWVWVLPECNVFDSGYADLNPLFQLAPYIFMFLCPAITMNLFAEEYKIGTMELLLTSPTATFHIILGKYFASLLMVICMLLLTTGYGCTIAYLASPMGNVDLASWLGAYIGLTLLSALFLSIGLLASSYTTNQVVAFLWASLSCFLIYQGLDAWATLQNWNAYSLWITHLGILYHYEALSRGVIDAYDVLYFTTLSSFFIYMTYLKLKKNV